MVLDQEFEVLPPWSETDFRVIIGRTRIEYDSTKEESNRKRHGYSLESAVHFLTRLILPVPSPLFMTTNSFLEKGEVRHNHMTLDDQGHVVFFVTTMRPHESVRIISLRRASDAERKLYTSHAKALGHDVPPNLVG
jgi:uncharacterized DUF497 family protein